MYRLVNIGNTYESYQNLISLYELNKEVLFGDIHLEMHQFFAANMSAVLGAVLDKFTTNFSDIHFDFLTPKIETILSKNDFLTYFGKQKVVDVFNTTVKFQKLNPKDGKYFKNYVVEELINGHKTDLPIMSVAVKERILEAIYEIFVNAQMHSETKFIYTSGQLFPTKNKIVFTIVDTGMGFREKINRTFDSNLTTIQAIKWAVQDRRTTKQGVSGGIGLAVLKEFIGINKGEIQIVSYDGFYQFDCNGETLKHFTGEFPGTIVNLQFRTDDISNYSLNSEIDINDIF